MDEFYKKMPSAKHVVLKHAVISSFLKWKTQSIRFSIPKYPNNLIPDINEWISVLMNERQTNPDQN